jgi:hypothetical protein
MDDNYLWDRSGEPDPELQQLEELLGTLRYEPRALQIPPNFRTARRASYFRPLAIAATLLLFAVATSLWINFNRRPQSIAALPAVGNEKPVVPQTVSAAESNQTAVAGIQKVVVTAKRHVARPRIVLAENRTRTLQAPAPVLTSEELAQKDEVLLALRLVSTKLNMAQRKLQGGSAPNVIRNQRKIG